MNRLLSPRQDDGTLPRDPRRTRSWAEISLAALSSNIKAINKRLTPDAEFLAVVKADGYGHGAGIIARECERQGVRHFGVATVEEGLTLRRAGVGADVYVFSAFLPEEAVDIVSADLIPFVSSLAQTRALIGVASRLPLPARCFLTIDTGMGREGGSPEEAMHIWESVQKSQVRITGIGTHLSRADEPGIGDAVSRQQSDVYFAFIRALSDRRDLANVDDGRGNRGVYLTMANSPATLRLPHERLPGGARAYLMRGGLLTYGIEPYRDAFAGAELQPILSWRSRVTLVRDFTAGATIGYGQSYTTERPSRIATLAAGYADGLSRRLSNQGVALVHGRRCPVVGRISMDQCQIDVTEIADQIAPGDVATLIGADGDAHITVRDMAEMIGTTPHEPTCGLSARVPRIYI